MNVTPVVRYMILCDDWGFDPAHPDRANIFGLLHDIDSLEDPPYPFIYQEMCVFLALTGGRGTSHLRL
jgi:hypothetical protein